MDAAWRRESFEAQRAAGRALAYRMLGAASEVDDIMQEAWIRWERLDDEPEDTRAMMLTIVSRLCLDMMGSARVRRERYVGPWLPEPLVEPDEQGPESSAMMRESLTIAFLHILEQLSPRERMVFLLRRVFEVDHARLAAELEISEEASRQLYARASRRFEAARAGEPASMETQREALSRLLGAVMSDDMEALRAVLHEDCVAYSDGGGRARAATRPVRGADACAKLLAGIGRKAEAGMEASWMTLNGQAALVLSKGEAILSVTHIEMSGTQIYRIYTQLNPDKLSHLNPLNS